MSVTLGVRDLRTHFFTKEGVAKAVDGVDFEVAHEVDADGRRRHGEGALGGGQPLLDLLAQHCAGGGGEFPAVSPKGDEPPAFAERGERRFQRGSAAHEVDCDIDAFAAGQLEQLLGHAAFRCIDRGVRAGFHARFEL